MALALVAAIAAVEHSMYVGGVLASLANTYGLLYVSLLMGYGLVEFPRSLWREAFPESQLRRCLIKSIAADEALFEIVWEVQDIESIADAVLMKIAREGSDDAYYNECVERVKKRKDELIATMSQDLRRRRHNNDRATDSNDEYGIKTPGKLPTLKHLARLNKRLMRTQDKLYGAMLRWEGLVKRIAFLTAHTDATTMIGDDTHAPLIQSTNTSTTWTKYLRSPFYKSAALIASLLSMLILWSEASLSAKRNLSPISLLLNDVQVSSIFIFRIIVQIPLLYMSICAYTSLFKLVSFVPANPHLGGHKQSDGPGLLFNTQILVRLQFPLCYNYLLTLKYDPATTTCAFLKQMGIMHPIPFFGSSFTIYGPLLMVTLCCFSLFNGYPRLLALVGVEHEDSILSGDKISLDVKLNEGIALIKRHADRVEHATDNDVPDTKPALPTVKKSKFEYHGNIGKKITPKVEDDDDDDEGFNSIRGKKSSSKFVAV